MAKFHDYNHDLRVEVDHGPRREQVTSYGDDLGRPSDPMPYEMIDWYALMKQALGKSANDQLTQRWLFGDPAFKGEGLLNTPNPQQPARDGRWIVDDPGYDPTATPEYQAALRFFSAPARTSISEKDVTMAMVETAFDDGERRLVLSPAESGSISSGRDEAAELRKTVANQKAEIAALEDRVSRLIHSRIRGRAAMFAETRSGAVRVWVGQLHDGEFWKQTEIGDDHACGYRISTEEAAAFCLAAKQPDEPPAEPADPRSEAMARAFARDGLLDAFGRPR